MKKEYIKPEYIEVDIEVDSMICESLTVTNEDVDDSDKSRERDTNGLFDW